MLQTEKKKLHPHGPLKVSMLLFAFDWRKSFEPIILNDGLFIKYTYLTGGFSLAFFNSSEVQRETGSVLCHGNSSIMGLFLERYRFHYWLFRSCAGNCVQNSSPKIVPQCNSRHYRPSLSSASSKWPKRYRKGLVTAQLHLSGVC